MAENKRSFPILEPAIGTGLEFLHPSDSDGTVVSGGPLNTSKVEHFFTEGYVIARNLLSAQHVRKLQEAFEIVEKASKPRGNLYDVLEFRAHEVAPDYLPVATSSPISCAIAQILPSKLENRARVLLNNVMFKLSGFSKGCDFHVDDSFFWPCARDAPGPGVNVWIPMDPVNSELGGGLTIVPQSFSEQFLDCREAILGKTCDIANLAPSLHQKLENLAITPDFDVGDVLFCTRFLFHRGCPFVDSSSDVAKKGIRRLSIRYMPGEAQAHTISFDDGQFSFSNPFSLANADPAKYPEAVPFST